MLLLNCPYSLCDPEIVPLAAAHACHNLSNLGYMQLKTEKNRLLTDNSFRRTNSKNVLKILRIGVKGHLTRKKINEESRKKCERNNYSK